MTPTRGDNGHERDIVIEVAEIETRIYPNQVDAYNPYLTVRRKIHSKAKQVAVAKGTYPVVLVLYFQHPSPPAEFIIPGAMYGNDGFEVPLNTSGAPSSFHAIRRVFLQGAELQPSKNTRISAVANMECINPTWMIAQREFNRRYNALAKRDPQAFLKTHFEVFENPDFYSPDLRVPRLDVFCNVFADLPLSLEDLSLGPHDRCWDGAVYRCIYEGDRFESEVRNWKKGA